MVTLFSVGTKNIENNILWAMRSDQKETILNFYHYHCHLISKDGGSVLERTEATVLSKALGASFSNLVGFESHPGHGCSSVLLTYFEVYQLAQS